jgi:hypothetical protein
MLHLIIIYLLLSFNIFAQYTGAKKDTSWMTNKQSRLYLSARSEMIFRKNASTKPSSKYKSYIARVKGSGSFKTKSSCNRNRVYTHRNKPYTHRSRGYTHRCDGCSIMRLTGNTKNNYK